MKPEFSWQIFGKKILKCQIWWKPVQWSPDFFQADIQTDRHDEANSRCSQFVKATENDGVHLGSVSSLLRVWNLEIVYIQTQMCHIGVI